MERTEQVEDLKRGHMSLFYYYEDYTLQIISHNRHKRLRDMLLQKASEVILMSFTLCIAIDLIRQSSRRVADG
jgi:hypothetical protein